MAKHDIDPVLQQLAQAINESGQAAAPIVVSVHGTVVNGALISEQRYFSELVEANPLMIEFGRSALAQAAVVVEPGLVVGELLLGQDAG